MINVLFLTRSLNYGGTEIQLATLATNLDQSVFSTSIVSYYSEGELVINIESAGIPFYTTNKSGRHDVIKFTINLIKIIYTVKPKVVYGFLYEPNIISAFLIFMFPSIHVIFGIRNANMDLSKYDYFSRLSKKLESLSAHFADLIIANSEAGKEECLLRGFPKNKLVVIHNGIDTDRFHPDPGKRKQFRENFNIPKNAIVIGLVGRVDPIKDHANFIHAARILSTKYNNIFFLCAGARNNPYWNGLSELIESSRLGKRLIWVDACDTIEDVYNGLDICCLSSISEGFPNAICEAMSCGIPCVTTDVGDTRKIIRDTGIVVPPKDPEALATGLETMINFPVRKRKELGLLARTRIIQQFSVERLVTETSQAILQLVQG